ncbi:MAG: MmcQ/YjbR family DNA-binding protein [Clostridia bacterium]|nr:MmcQ/YjbR family DNA-binding protein [Clostridia bacterium]
MFEEYFFKKRPNADKLLSFGFTDDGERFRYKTSVFSGEFTLEVTVDKFGSVDTQLTEIDTGEAYILYKTDAVGSFVGEVRQAVGKVLAEIAKMCFDSLSLYDGQADELVEFVKNEYGDDAEHLWEKFPEYAIWRRKDTKKWYLLIGKVEGRKIGYDTDEQLWIIDLRMKKEDKQRILSKEGFCPGWHMNKNSWYTVVLNDVVPIDQIKLCVKTSYDLAKK